MGMGCHHAVHGEYNLRSNGWSTVYTGVEVEVEVDKKLP